MAVATPNTKIQRDALAPARGLFIGEDTIGNRTIYENWKTAAEGSLSQVELMDFSLGRLLDSLPLPHQVRSSVAQRRKLVRLIREFEPDYLVASTYNPLKFAHDVLARVPTGIMMDCTPRQFDDLRYWDDPSDRIPGVRQAKFGLMRTVFRRAAALCPMSTWAARSLRDDYGVDSERIHVVPPGVDTRAWVPIEKEQGSSVELVFLGGDFVRKGGPELLQWYRERGRGRVRLTLVTRGRVPEEPGVRVVRAEYNSAELRDSVQRADVFVLPTKADCFSHAACEAMACGLPVVITDVGGIADIVEPGTTGYLLPPGDAAALDQALDALVTSPALRREMGTAGRARVVDLFDSRTNFSRLVDIGAEISAETAVNA